MTELWLPLHDIPIDGRTYTFTDQALWKDRWQKFNLAVRPDSDIVAEVFVLPQGGTGVLLRGTLKGSVKMACDRCTALFPVTIDESFDLYEELASKEEPDLGDDRVRKVGDILEVDMGALLWEEFALALPLKPLCTEECQGVCSGCGIDLNREKCTCERDEGDPRLAVFRNLKLK